MRLFTSRLVLLIITLVTLCAAAATTPPVRAQGGTAPATAPVTTPRPVSDNEVNQIAKNLYCPVCQNIPLEVCETEACARWREQVRDLLSQGYTETQVRQYFIERFGSKTVGTPTDPAGQLLTIALPFGLIGLVGVVIAFSLVRWRIRRPAQGLETQADENDENEMHSVPPDDYRARLEEEIRKRD